MLMLFVVFLFCLGFWMISLFVKSMARHVVKTEDKKTASPPSDAYPQENGTLDSRFSKLDDDPSAGPVPGYDVSESCDDIFEYSESEKTLELDVDKPEYRDLAYYSPEIQSLLQNNETLWTVLDLLKQEQELKNDLAELHALRADPWIQYSLLFLDYLDDHPEYVSGLTSPSSKQSMQVLQETKRRHEQREREFDESMAYLRSLPSDPRYRKLRMLMDTLKAELIHRESSNASIDSNAPQNSEIEYTMQEVDQKRRELEAAERQYREAEARTAYLQAIRALQHEAKGAAENDCDDAAYWTALDDALLLGYWLTRDK